MHGGEHHEIGDDNDDGFPSPEPRTDSRSSLPREFRAWWRLRIIKRDESFSLFFLPESEYMESGLRSVEHQGAHEAGGAPRGVGRASHPRGQGVGPLTWILLPVLFYIPKITSVYFQVNPRTFISVQK